MQGYIDELLAAGVVTVIWDAVNHLEGENLVDALFILNHLSMCGRCSALLAANAFPVLMCVVSRARLEQDTSAYNASILYKPSTGGGREDMDVDVLHAICSS